MTEPSPIFAPVQPGEAAGRFSPARRRQVLAVALFALAGPPIGGLILLLKLAPPGSEALRLGNMPLVFAYSYAFGIVQALIAGIGTVMLAARRGGTSLWHPLLVVAAIHVVGVGAMVAVSLAMRWPLRGAVEFPLMISGPVSFIAATICWFLAWPLLKRR